jgi:tetratricopeptide (TPR) repeat protein
MRKLAPAAPAALLVLGLLTPMAWAQSKLEKAIEKANEQVEKGRPEDAVKTLTRAAEELGAEGYVPLGRLQERLGDLEAAKAAYDQAKATASPEYRPEALAAAAHFALREGTGRDALALAQQAVRTKASAETLAALARAQVRTANGPGALESADKAIAADPRSVLAHVAKGEALLSLGENAKAEQALRKAIELDSHSALAETRLARVLLALGRPADAVAAARKATELDEKSGESFAILGAAILAENRNNWGDAIAQAQQGAFLDPGSPIVLTAVGRIFEANARIDYALSSYRKALATDPGFAPARLALIQAQLARGDRDAAIEEAKKAAADMPTAPEIQLLLGEMSVRKGDYAAALSYLDRAMKGLPGNADGWALLGRAEQFSGRPADAADAYARAVELAPRNFSYRSTYGLLLGVTGDLEGGLAQLKNVVESPGYKAADAWSNLGWVYRHMDKPRESIAAYRKALQIDPEQAQAALGLGWAHYKTQEYDKAIAAYLQAVQLDAKLAADAYWGAAWASIYKRDAARARDFQQKAVAAGRDDPQLATYVDKLERNLLRTAEEMEKLRRQQEREEERNRRIEAANNAIRSNNPAVRARGAHELAVAGAAAVDNLTYLMQADPDWNVRIAATRALGSLGRVAKKALPNIEGILRQDPYDPGPIATPEQLRLQMLDGDYRRALREALRKIQGS